jgi:hypothetical protein
VGALCCGPLHAPEGAPCSIEGRLGCTFGSARNEKIPKRRTTAGNAAGAQSVGRRRSISLILISIGPSSVVVPLPTRNPVWERPRSSPRPVRARFHAISRGQNQNLEDKMPRSSPRPVRARSIVIYLEDKIKNLEDKINLEASIQKIQTIYSAKFASCRIQNPKSNSVSKFQNQKPSLTHSRQPKTRAGRPTKKSDR